MKLYATVTSERATKGQGGNDFLNIDIYIDDKKNPRFRLHINKFQDSEHDNIVLVDLNKPFPNDVYRQALNKIKGKRQKGNLCNCGQNPGFHIPQDNCN